MSLLKKGKKQSMRKVKNVQKPNENTFRFSEFKTPTTVNEFRTNLKKFYVCVGKNEDELYVQNCKKDRIRISELSSLDDLYKYSSSEYLTPQISPKVNPIKDFKVFMMETNQIFSMNGYFEDENNFEIIKDKLDFISNYNPKWIGLDNQLYREFYYLTLGEYSGYILSENN
jgi:hypothetical protein